MQTSTWDDPARWDELKQASSCPICRAGTPLDVLADFVIEPFDLPASDLAVFWDDAMLAARVLNRVFEPAKLNYEIHGNTVPHLHLHLLPRFARDPFVGGPVDFRQPAFVRPEADLARLSDELLAASKQERHD